jgi:hypothetical protein
MNKDLGIKSINIKQLLARYSKRFGKHVIFAAILAVLLVYLLLVFRISSLAKAEPSPDQEVEVGNSIPKVDPKAVNQIQSLEQTNTQVHALFEQARNNPFQE